MTLSHTSHNIIITQYASGLCGQTDRQTRSSQYVAVAPIPGRSNQWWCRTLFFQVQSATDHRCVPVWPQKHCTYV